MGVPTGTWCNNNVSMASTVWHGLPPGVLFHLRRYLTFVSCICLHVFIWIRYCYENEICLSCLEPKCATLFRCHIVAFVYFVFIIWVCVLCSCRGQGLNSLSLYLIFVNHTKCHDTSLDLFGVKSSDLRMIFEIIKRKRNFKTSFMT